MKQELKDKINSTIDDYIGDTYDPSISHLKRKIDEYDYQCETVWETIPIRDLLVEKYNQLRYGVEKNQHTIKSGFIDIDKMLGGFYLGEFTVIGGRPGMGKTQFLIDLALNISIEIPTLYFTFDLSPSELSSRFISTITGIPMPYLLQSRLSEENKSRLNLIKETLDKRQLFISHSDKKSINSLRSHCEKMVNEKGVKVILIDCLHNMSCTTYRKDKEAEINYISDELKRIAKEYNVCLIASSQLDRVIECRDDRFGIPQLSDLQDGGSIEQNADKVLLIFRPEYYNIVEDERGNSLENLAFIKVAKNKNGNLGSINLQIDADFTRFVSFNEHRPNKRN